MRTPNGDAVLARTTSPLGETTDGAAPEDFEPSGAWIPMFIRFTA
jgi:hypothetical protein